MEIAAEAPRYALKARIRLDFERALLEAAQDRAIRRGAQGTTRPARRGGAYWWTLRRVAVPLFRAMPWPLRRSLMRAAAGYPKGWQRPG
jgi:hypothetical protein